MKEKTHYTVEHDDKEILMEYITAVIRERRQSADVQVGTDANKFKADIQWSDVKEAGTRLLAAIRGIIGDAITIIGTLVSTGKAFGELALNGIGKLFGQPPKTDSILIGQREMFNKFKTVGDIVKGKQGALGRKPDTLSQIKDLLGENKLEENIQFGQLLLEESIARDDFINSVKSSVGGFVSRMNEIQAGGLDLNTSLSEISTLSGGMLPPEVTALFDKGEAERLSGEEMSPEDLEKIKSHISDNVIPSLVGPLSIAFLTDAAAKITGEIGVERPDLVPEVTEIYNQAISEFK